MRFKKAAITSLSQVHSHFSLFTHTYPLFSEIVETSVFSASAATANNRSLIVLQAINVALPFRSAVALAADGEEAPDGSMAPVTRPYVVGAPALEPAYESAAKESAPDPGSAQEPLAAADATVE